MTAPRPGIHVGIQLGHRASDRGADNFLAKRCDVLIPVESSAIEMSCHDLGLRRP